MMFDFVISCSPRIWTKHWKSIWFTQWWFTNDICALLIEGKEKKKYWRRMQQNNNNFSIKIPSFHSFNLFYCSGCASTGLRKMNFIFLLSYFRTGSFICYVNQFVVHKFIVVAEEEFFFFPFGSLSFHSFELRRWWNGTNAWIVFNTNWQPHKRYKNSSRQ